MRVMVTGSLGTLGKPLVQRLRADGHEVVGVDIRHGEDNVRADVSNFRQMETVVRRHMPALVYHLAAEFGRNNGEEYYESLWKTNAIGTKNILRLAASHSFRLIHASSSEVYGDDPSHDGGLISEESKFGKHFNDYAMSKVVNEWQIRNASEQDEVEAMTLRFFNAYGPGEHYHDYRSVVCLFVYRMLHNLPIIAYEDYHRVFMYVDDLIATLARAATRFEPGAVVNIGGVEYRSIRELVDVILNEIPEHSGDIEWASKEKFNVRNKRPDISLARSMFDHDPATKLEFGIAATVRWTREFYGKV